MKLSFITLACITMACSLLGISACRPPAAPQTRHLPSGEEHLKTGAALMENRAFLHASYYLEAALQTHPVEEAVLPPLISAQIRAGRFLAANTNLNRLVTLCPDHPYVAPLQQAVQRMIHNREIPTQQGGTQ